MKRILAMVMAALLMLAGIGALAEDGRLTVQGVGVVRVDADRANICLGVRIADADVASAQAAVNEALDAVIAALKDMGLGADALSTSGIGIYPNWDYSDGETITGYTAYNSLNVAVTDVEKVGAYIDAAFAASANSLDYVEFSAADTDEAGRKALTLAMESALEKARVLAEAAGVGLGDIVSVTENPDGYYVAENAFARTEEADAGGGTKVLAAQQRVTATVSVTFDISGKK